MKPREEHTNMHGSASSEFDWLINWFAEECDGDWEHNEGITIETLDNPGWKLTIELWETDLENQPFESIEFNMESTEVGVQTRWYLCKVEDQKFRAFCGVLDLPVVIGIFRKWVEEIRSEGTAVEEAPHKRTLN